MPAIQPMPSPKGTNHEKLFVLHGSPRGFAYDEKADAAAGSDPVELATWIKENMTPDDIQALLDELKAVAATTSTASDAATAWRTSLRQGFSNCPRLSDRPASAAAISAFNKQFPTAKAPRVV